MPRVLARCALVSLLAFQSHWLDDLGSGAADTAGIAVSAIGTALLAAGWWLMPGRAGRTVLMGAWIFTGYISAADLAGLRADGSVAPSLVDHWRLVLGPSTTIAVTLAGLAAAAGLTGLWRLRRARTETRPA